LKGSGSEKDIRRHAPAGLTSSDYSPADLHGGIDPGFSGSSRLESEARPPPAPSGGDPVSPFGFGASQGHVYSRGPKPPFSTLFISKNGAIGFERREPLAAALSGHPLLMEEGRVASDVDTGYYTHLHPCTAVAIDTAARSCSA